MKNLPPKLLIGNTFCDRFITSILPSKKHVIALNTKPLPILEFNDDTISAIHTPQPLYPLNTKKTHVNLRLVEPTEIDAYTQRLVTVTAPVDGLFTIENHSNL